MLFANGADVDPYRDWNGALLRKDGPEVGYLATRWQACALCRQPGLESVGACSGAMLRGVSPKGMFGTRKMYLFEKLRKVRCQQPRHPANSIYGWLILLACLAAPASLLAQCSSAPQGEIRANPGRPTVADPADVSEYGVLEMEYGWNHTWLGEQVHENDFGALLKFSVLCDLEIRWSPDTLVRQGGQTGFGDNWIGAQYRFYHQTHKVPAMAVSYMVKIPSASAARNLGSGRVDQQIKFLASKDLGATHFDFNASALVIGRPVGGGRDSAAEIDLSFSHPVWSKLGLTGEIYGDTRLNNFNPGFTSTLWALTYTLTPRLVVDAGMDTALTSNAPFRKRFTMGFVYSIGELYPGLRRRLWHR
jgi:Putative MetA-pathway of phenol degradation